MNDFQKTIKILDEISGSPRRHHDLLIKIAQLSPSAVVKAARELRIEEKLSPQEAETYALSG